ncbi:MAG TPA: hypothetical protein VFT72_03995 [Opitutaceae bacterium]|nr:hypothetical protein [Opitutaceae bacterium]
MSLINEALKKAQKERENTPGTPPPPVQPPLVASSSNPSDEPRRTARADTGSKNGVLIAGACAIVAVSVAATVYFLRGPSPTQPAAAPSVSAAQIHTAQSSAAAHPASTPAPVVASQLPPPTEAPRPTALPTTPAVVSAAPTAAPQVRPSVTEPAPVKNTFRIQGMIDKFRVSGIRLSDTDSRVILNDHLFRANDVVESSLGLRLIKIEAHALSFVDAEGNNYQKRF